MNIKTFKSFVVVETSLEAIHWWPDAPSFEGYLAQPHRHLFTVEAELVVTHPDRDLEINKLKREMDSLLAEFAEAENRKYRSSNEIVRLVSDIPTIGPTSCEQLAEVVATYFIDRYKVPEGKVTVREDGILGGGAAWSR